MKPSKVKPLGISRLTEAVARDFLLVQNRHVDPVKVGMETCALDNAGTGNFCTIISNRPVIFYTNNSADPLHPREVHLTWPRSGSASRLGDIRQFRIIIKNADRHKSNVNASNILISQSYL
jgi:hypothetical protein